MTHHNKLFIFLNQHNLIVDCDGIVKKNNKDITAFYTLFIFYIYFIYVHQQCDDTIVLYSTTIYMKFVEYVLKLNNKPYINLTKPYINHQCYMTSDHLLIPLSPQLEDFSNEKVPLIPLSEEEIDELEKHTGLKHLASCQDDILSKRSHINAYKIINSQQKIVPCDIEMNHNNVRIITKESIYKPKMILTDYTSHLKINEVVNISLYATEHQHIYIENKYLVNDKYKLELLSDGVNDDIVILPFYSLEKPRSQIAFHPYHLPKTADYVMSIMILTQAFINAFY